MARYFPCTVSSIPEAVDYVQQYLEEMHFDATTVIKTLLRLEDLINGIILKADNPNEKYVVYPIKKFGFFGTLSIIIRCRGKILTIDDVVPKFEFDGLEPQVIEVLNKRAKPLMSDGLILRYRLGMNIAGIEVGFAKVSRIGMNLMTMLGGVLLGIILRLLLPQVAASFVAAEIFGTATTIFFNLLKMIVVPLVFFSIITCVSGFADIRELGSIGIKTIALFIVFSVVGLLIGYGVFAVFPSGKPEIQSMLDCPKTVETVGSMPSMAWQQIKTFLLNIFPSNLLGAFIENNILGVVFIALIIGIAVTKLQPEKAAAVNNAIDVCNGLVTKVTSVITGMIPVLTFCSLAKLAMTVDVALIGTLARYVGAIAVGFGLILICYILALLICRINPIAFWKGFSPAFISGFELASSVATVPTSLDCCVNRLKIPRGITYFVIPLGATINMNGSCIVLLISCLFLSNVFCVEATFSMMIPAMLMILLLAMAAPGVPGTMVIMMATVLPIIGVPAEAANVLIWVSTLTDMLMIPINSMGDAVTAMIISNRMMKKSRKAG